MIPPERASAQHQSLNERQSISETISSTSFCSLRQQPRPLYVWECRAARSIFPHRCVYQFLQRAVGARLFSGNIKAHIAHINSNFMTTLISIWNEMACARHRDPHKCRVQSQAHTHFSYRQREVRTLYFRRRGFGCGWNIYEGNWRCLLLRGIDSEPLPNRSFNWMREARACVYELQLGPNEFFPPWKLMKTET